MRTRRLHKILFVAAAAMLLVSAGSAADQGREFHWSGKLSPDQLLEIKNINGDIDARLASGDEAQVTAEKSGPEADQVKIEVVPSREGVTICAVYPSGIFGGDSSHSCESGDRGSSNNVHGDRTKVHFTVLVPRRVRFSGMNVNGNINADDLQGEVRANTVNGSVRVSTAEWAEVKTVNGSVHAVNAAWNGTLAIASVNGSVDLRMPDDLNAEVSFQSVNGTMSSDFPFQLQTTGPLDIMLMGRWATAGGSSQLKPSMATCNSAKEAPGYNRGLLHRRFESILLWGSCGPGCFGAQIVEDFYS